MPQIKDSFETAIKKLEAIISSLENDDQTLKEALENFEKGVKLMRTCDNHLRNAEGKLKELLKGENGEFVEKTLGITLDSFTDGEDPDE